jgi:hypothetical protein
VKLTTLAQGAYIAMANSAGETGVTRTYVSAGTAYERIPVAADGDYAFLIDPEEATVGTFTLTASLAAP